MSCVTDILISYEYVASPKLFFLWQAFDCEKIRRCFVQIYWSYTNIIDSAIHKSTPLRLIVVAGMRYHLAVASTSWWIGHGRLVSTLATIVWLDVYLICKVHGLETTLQLMKQFVYNWHLPCYQCMEIFHASSEQRFIHITRDFGFTVMGVCWSLLYNLYSR